MIEYADINFLKFFCVSFSLIKMIIIIIIILYMYIQVKVSKVQVLGLNRTKNDIVTEQVKDVLKSENLLEV